jgi:hypothetical protein
MSKAISLALAMMATVAFTRQAECAELYRVSGTVVDAQSGAPLPRVRVALARHEQPSAETTMVTGADGRFSFDVPGGKFTLNALYRGLREGFGQRTLGAGFGTAVITGPDLDTSQLVFRWRGFGAITGKVSDEWGGPIEAALVQVQRLFVFAGERQVKTYGWYWTNDLGEYYFGPLAEGTYFVAVTGHPWYSAADLSVGPNRPPGESLSYAPQYYPNATDPAGAAPIVVKAGGEVRADFTLTAMPGAAIRVHAEAIKPDAGELQLQLAMAGIRGAESYQRVQAVYGDSAVLSGIPPGHYTLRLFSSGQAGVFAQQTVDVGTGDVDVALAPQPWPTIAGKVDFKKPEMARHGTLMVVLIDQDTGHSIMARVGADGSFSIPSGPVGKARVLLSGQDGFSVESIDAQGAGLLDDMLDIAGGAAVRLHIVANEDTGRVQGYATNGPHPQEGALVVLAPLRPDAKAHEYRAFQSDSDGSFDFRDVRAGDYLLFAVDDVGLEYARREAIQGFLSNAKPIHVEARGNQREQIPIIPAEPAQR